MKNEQADIVVIGAGAAGLAATVAAAECGMKVITFEKAGRTGGAGNAGTNGIFAVESKVQQSQGIKLTREELLKAHMEHAHWQVDARLVKAFYDKSASTIEWLENMGIEYAGATPRFPGGYSTWHTVKSFGEKVRKSMGTAVTVKILTQRAREMGAQIYLRTPVKKIIKKRGCIAGVQAEDIDGNDITVNTVTVIIAIGGFGDNPEWIKRYTGFEVDKNFYPFRIKGLTGDGIRMAWELGAARTKMIMQVTHALYKGISRALFSVELAFQQPNLMVNILGERFANEEVIMDFTSGGNAISIQKDGCAFMIFDKNTKEYYSQPGDKETYADPSVTSLGTLDADLKKAHNKSPDLVFITDSLKELSAGSGIDYPVLEETVKEYNKACDTGWDDVFNKKPIYLRSVRQAPFYAIKWYPGAYGSLGGIKINYRAEVLDNDYKLIPGLYAAGSDANSIYGDSYPLNLPGNTAGFALNSGRIAAENAAKYVKSRL